MRNLNSRNFARQVVTPVTVVGDVHGQVVCREFHLHFESHFPHVESAPGHVLSRPFRTVYPGAVL